MSVIGPRPALWNQDVLTAERDKYGANDVKPGLTGWAQINGRDELEIPVKAKLDGEYVQKESLLCVVSYEPLYGLLRRRMETYRSDTEGQPDITLDGTKEDYEKLRKQYPHLSIEECEYSCAGAEFYMKLLKHQGFMIHASAVEKEGKAYLFSAPSGTGKSTHAQLWRQTFKGEPIRIINDDKPAVCLQNGVFYACGTPFSGKTDKNENRKAPIQGLCMLHRGKTNKIQKITSGEALPLILPQTLFYGDEEETNLLLSFLDRFLQSVPVYKMECTMEEEAAKTAYFCMKGEEK